MYHYAHRDFEISRTHFNTAAQQHGPAAGTDNIPVAVTLDPYALDPLSSSTLTAP